MRAGQRPWSMTAGESVGGDTLAQKLSTPFADDSLRQHVYYTLIH